MATGTVKTLVKNRGFGFIRPKGSEEDVFFHTTSLPAGEFEQLNEGQAVEFDTEQDPNNRARTRAVNVKVLDEVN